MGKITGSEKPGELPEKVSLLYDAVLQMFMEGVDLNSITVSSITEKAGIGKGTVYDYFSSKEELVACAILSAMKRMTEGLLGRLESMDSLKSQLAGLFDWVENSFNERQCLIRFLNLLTDGSSIGQMLRQKMETRGIDRFLPMGIFQRMLETAVKEGEIEPKLPLDYLAYMIYSKLVGYVTYLYLEEQEKEKRGKMRILVYQSILRELDVEA